MKIKYPFVPVPSNVAKGGHGPVNVAVLNALLSHGKPRDAGDVTVVYGIRASASTVAHESGCDRKSVFQAQRYWRTCCDAGLYGEKHVCKGIKRNTGVRLMVRNRFGKASEMEIHITNTKNGTGGKSNSSTEEEAANAENGTGQLVEKLREVYRKRNWGIPKTARVAMPETER